MQKLMEGMTRIVRSLHPWCLLHLVEWGTEDEMAMAVDKIIEQATESLERGRARGYEERPSGSGAGGGPCTR